MVIKHYYKNKQIHCNYTLQFNYNYTIILLGDIDFFNFLIHLEQVYIYKDNHLYKS